MSITFNLGCYFDTPTKTQPVPDQYEMYNLTIDPLETENLAYTAYVNPDITQIQVVLDRLLQEQCRKKRLYPTSGDVPGKGLPQYCYMGN